MKSFYSILREVSLLMGWIRVVQIQRVLLPTLYDDVWRVALDVVGRVLFLSHTNVYSNVTFIAKDFQGFYLCSC